MRVLSIILTFLVGTLYFQQSYKSVDVEFTNNGKKIQGVQYFYLHRDTAYRLPYKDGKVSIDNSLLKSPSIILIAVYKGKVINFKIETDSFYFIKIKSSKKGLKTIYQVNFGSEYDELVTPYSINKIAAFR